MNILLSAYACEPNKGSEASVGWNWAIELAKFGHEVWVITRENNRSPIESFLAHSPLPNLHFIYYDLPQVVKRWKKGRQGVHIYYLLWQLGAYLKVRPLTKSVGLDLVHHVTFVSVRQPSFMGLLGIPFVFGPVAGGETTPWRLRKSFPLGGWLRDLARDIFNVLIRMDPLMHLTLAKATKIYVTSKQTQSLLPRRYRSKSLVRLAIGIESDILHPLQPASPPDQSPFRILFVGQLLYLKGIHLGLRAFAQLLSKVPDSRLTLVGSGSEQTWLQNLSKNLEIEPYVEWIPWMERDAILNTYSQYDVLLFPSLHDSGGMVVLEAMSQGLPVICLDLGGPGVMVNNTCGRIVGTQGRSEQEVVESLASELYALAKNQALLEQLGESAKIRASEFNWNRRVSSMYSVSGEMQNFPVIESPHD